MNTGAAEFPSLADFIRELLRRDCAKARFWFCTCSEWGDVAELRRAMEGFGGDLA
jgi:hypothetical protein